MDSGPKLMTLHSRELGALEQCAVGLITGQVSPRQWIRVSPAKQAAYINPHSYSWSSNNQTTSPQVPETKTNWAKLTKEPSFPSTINFYWLSNRISCSYDALQPICRLGNFLRSPLSPQVGANPDPLTPICHQEEVGHCKADFDKICSAEGSI